MWNRAISYLVQTAIRLLTDVSALFLPVSVIPRWQVSSEQGLCGSKFRKRSKLWSTENFRKMSCQKMWSCVWSGISVRTELHIVHWNLQEVQWRICLWQAAWQLPTWQLRQVQNVRSLLLMKRRQSTARLSWTISRRVLSEMRMPHILILWPIVQKIWFRLWHARLR